MIKSLQIIYIFFLFTSCSLFKSEESKNPLENIEYAKEIVLTIEPKWFDTAKRFKLVSQTGENEPHLFFDVNPDTNLKEKKINFIATTIQDEKYGYELDLVSGKHYVSNAFCSQDDIWKKVSSVDRPPFTEGVIPRYLDQLNKPQKIIVFGESDYYKKNYQDNFFEAKIVGGFIEQSCPSGVCTDPTSWLSRLVLVGVQPENSKYKKITNMKELMEVVDWKNVEAFIENGKGKNYLMEKFYPGFRMGAVVDGPQALSFFMKNSYFFSVDRMKNLKFSCYKLYDYTWKTLSFESILEKPATTKDEINQKALLIEKIRKENRQDVFFSQRFMTLYKKFQSKYETCFEYVYPASINDDRKRFWLFSYLQAFSHLQKLGYYFNCSRNAWEVNPRIEKDKRLYSLKDQFRDCSSRSIDLAFEFAVNYLKTLKLDYKPSYRFVDYDRINMGTHNKLYSWVKSSGKALSCSDKEVRDFSANLETFPKDIFWDKKEVKVKESSNLGDIIY